MVSSADQSMLLINRDADVIPFVMMIPVRKTLPRGLVKDGLMNTAPHVSVEDFHHQNLAISVLIVISRCLCTCQKDELPVVCGTGAASMSLYPDQHHTHQNHCVASISLTGSHPNHGQPLSRPSSCLSVECQ